MFGELWFHAGDASVDEKCRDTEHEMVGTVAEIQNMLKEGDEEVRGDTLIMLARLVDQHGDVR